MNRRRTWLLVTGAAALVFSLWLALRSNEWVPEPMADLEMRCFDESAPVPWSFCINRAREGTSGDVLYHLHGRNGSARWWNDATYYTAKVHEAWRAHGTKPPIVVSISFGKLWLLNDDLLPVFLETVLARVERELGIEVAHRMIVGESMGGINTLIAALKTQGVFTKAAALCPPLATVSPYASLGELYDYVSKSSTSWRRAAMLLVFARRFFSDEAAWGRYDPLRLAREYRGDTKLYLSCGAQDDWGCMEGSLALVTNLEESGRAITFERRPGGHCDIDAGSLARFLAEP